MFCASYDPKMTLLLPDLEKRTRLAVSAYWKTLGSQGERQASASAKQDYGNRAKVTGGKQMNGFCDLVELVLADNGVKGCRIYRDSPLEIPGFFRPSKRWDMLIMHKGQLVAALEFKSQLGPSFGNNLNNRAEEAIGTGSDAQVAYRENAFGKGAPRPWLGWLMLLEDCDKSKAPVGVKEPHFPVFPEFRNTSYAMRYELLLRKLRTENLFNEAALIMTCGDDAKSGAYTEPAEDLGIKRFLASLVGHASGIVAS